jgi:hypothetical protein
MSKDEIKNYVNEMKKYTEELKKSPEKSKTFLVDAGIYTKSGNLSKNYK